MLKVLQETRAVIFDVDGVIWIAGSLADGAPELFTALSTSAFPFCLLTNGCNSTKAARMQTLIRAGLHLGCEQLVSLAEITTQRLLDIGVGSVMYLGAPSVAEEISKHVVIKANGHVDAVVIGDMFDHYDRNILDRAAKAIVDGALLVAMQRNGRWSDGKNWYIDNGFWVAGLEFVTGKQALVIGKPSSWAYRAAVQRLKMHSLAMKEIAFISDDAESDLKGAKEAGLTTVHLGIFAGFPWVDVTIKDLRTLQSALLGERCRA